MIDWTVASLVDTQAAIADGRLSARDLAELTLARIGEHGDRLGCFYAFDADLLRAKADAADRSQSQGIAPASLHGIPLAHKDMFSRLGRVSTYGSKLHDAGPSTSTATVLSRLDDAGAIDFGQLAM